MYIPIYSLFREYVMYPSSCCLLVFSLCRKISSSTTSHIATSDEEESEHVTSKS